MIEIITQFGKHKKKNSVRFIPLFLYHSVLIKIDQLTCDTDLRYPELLRHVVSCNLFELQIQTKVLKEESCDPL